AAGEFHVDVFRDSGDAFDFGAVLAASEGGVEVDEVDPLGALVDPVGGGVGGISVAGFGAGFALGESHSFAVGDVDRGQQGERGGGVELAHVVYLSTCIADARRRLR